MKHGFPTLAEVQANELARRDAGAQAADVAAALSGLAAFARKVDGWLLGTASAAGLAAGICLTIWWPERDQSSAVAFVAMALLTLVGGAVYVRHTIWHRLYGGTIFGWRPKVLDDPILAPVYALIERCANGQVLVETHLGERIDKSFFRNAVAPLLASDFIEERLLVRSEFRRRNYGPQLHAVSPLTDAGQSELAAERPPLSPLASDGPQLPTASDIGLGIGHGTGRTGAEETPLRNFDPKVQWLVGGTWAQFIRGLAAFLDTLPPHKQKWHRIVLIVGRRELRKGGQYGAQTYAIKQIISALKAANEKFPDTERGDATTTIKKLLSGQSGTKDITGHFFGPGSDQPQKTDVPPDLNG